MKVVKVEEMTENFLELKEKTDQFYERLVELALQTSKEFADYEAYHIIGNSIFRLLAKLCMNTYDPEDTKMQFIKGFEAYFENLKKIGDN